MNTPQEFCKLVGVKLGAKSRGTFHPAKFGNYNGYTAVILDYSNKKATAHGFVEVPEDTGTNGTWVFASRSFDPTDDEYIYYLWDEWQEAYGGGQPVIEWDTTYER